jgi:hypothetical protein
LSFCIGLDISNEFAPRPDVHAVAARFRIRFISRSTDARFFVFFGSCVDFSADVLDDRFRDDRAPLCIDPGTQLFPFTERVSLI